MFSTVVARLSLVAALVGGAVALPGAGVAQAQDAKGGDIDLNTFHFAMDSRGYLTLNSSQPLGKKEFSFGIVTNYGRKLLAFDDGTDSFVVQNVVTPTFHGALGLKFGPVELELAVSIPFGITNGDRNPDFTNGTATPNDDDQWGVSGQGIGNIGVHAKVRFLKTTRGAKIGLAAIVGAYLPTVSEKSRFLGTTKMAPEAGIVIDKEIGKDRRLRFALNAGFRVTAADPYTDSGYTDTIDGMDVASPSTGETIDTGPGEIPVGFGVAWAITPQKFDVVGEVTAAIPTGGENYFPAEALAGIKVYLGRNSFLSLGGGYGLMPGKGGSNEGRAFIAIILEPNLGDRDHDGIKDDVDDCPDDPEDEDGFQDEDGCPEDDNDRDGIKDWDDSCPLNPEDKDNFEDEDGCPEGNKNDRDGDGILDDVDQCPDDPEDFDEFEDQDGCPDPDNDQDGILDVDDLCPMDPEDKDDWEDEDGCPDPDNDKDRILDNDDKCVNDPENYNGYEDDDGCPDKGRVVVTDTNIEILDKVYFEYDKAVILEKSYGILDAVASTLEGNSDIQLIEIQGHTDSRGNDAYNLDLSDRRAASVKKYLVEKGIDENRLTSQGYGETQPIDKKKNEKAYAKNRRVEFLILKRGGD
jgi:outer membrane protein OmpA-like peptidoglycan-associated protein